MICTRGIDLENSGSEIRAFLARTLGFTIFSVVGRVKQWLTVVRVVLGQALAAGIGQGNFLTAIR